LAWLWVVPCVLLTAVVIAGARVRRSIKTLDAGQAPAPERWPRLSVIVPACNEATTLEAALSTLLAQTYPDLEIVLIDDRSTDQTGEIVDRLARADPRIKPVHVKELPPGWLGKLHAMHLGTQAATGEWLLFTDADVHHGPQALQTAIASALADRLDHLALMPALVAKDALLRGTLVSFGAGFLLFLRPEQVADPRSPKAIGVGAFNLVRRTAFDRTPGFEWLKMEIADDVGLAMMIKAHGGKSDFRLAQQILSLEWYASAGAMVHGLEKNLFGTVARFNLLRVGLMLAGMIVVNLAPFVALAFGGWIAVFGAIALFAMARVGLVSAEVAGFPWWTAFFGPLGSALLGFALLRSAALALRAGGVRWRDTFYPLNELRRGQRVLL
jgi:hypothetical protein